MYVPANDTATYLNQDVYGEISYEDYSYADYEGKTTMDMLIAPKFRLWMLLAIIVGFFTMMTIGVCCVMRVRIPRTKREIEVMAQRRKFRGRSSSWVKAQMGGKGNEMPDDGLLIDEGSGKRGKNVIVMQSLRPPDGKLNASSPSLSDMSCKSNASTRPDNTATDSEECAVEPTGSVRESAALHGAQSPSATTAQDHENAEIRDYGNCLAVDGSERYLRNTDITAITSV